MSQTYDLKQELQMLDPGEIRLFTDAFGEMWVEFRDGQTVGPLRAQRPFPLSRAGELVLLTGPEDLEVGFIRKVDELEQDSRAVLEAELEQAYFMARITRVDAIRTRSFVPEWEVETDRGARIFQLNSGRRDIRVMEAGRVLVRDADGNRYEISNYRRLDPLSRALVETQI